MNKPILKVKVVDTWSDLSATDNQIIRLLQKHYDVRHVSKNPALLIYSCFGHQHTQFTNLDCVKLFFTGENTGPDFTQCDYALGFDNMEFGDRYLRVPLFAAHGQMEAIINRAPVTQAEVDRRTRFCNFIYSNRRAAPLRQEVFRKLSQYKTVESAGKYLRNVVIDEHTNIKTGRGAPNTFDKLKVQAQYRFSIAFENSEYDGYTTEKIMDAYIARTIPIYWGNPDVLQDFNPASFINAYDFETIDELVAEVRRIDTDPEAYLDMLNAPVFTEALLAQHPFGERVEAFLLGIVGQSPAVARKRPKSGANRRLELQAAQKYRTFAARMAQLLPSKNNTYENVAGYSLIKEPKHRP